MRAGEQLLRRGFSVKKLMEEAPHIRFTPYLVMLSEAKST